MLKRFSKFLLALLLIIATLSSICFATDAVTTSETTENATAVTTSETEEEIHTGDLYLFDNNVVMDKLVDGNVFIFGSNVEVTGQVNGDLFVFANKVNFNKSYVRYAIYACATSVKYDGACNDLYVATTDLEMTYDSYIVRDLKALSKTNIIKAAVGRDVDLIGDTVNFGEGEDAAVIYGNLRYSLPEEIEIPEGVITESGNVTYTKSPLTTDDFKSASTLSIITDIVVGFVTAIVTTLALFIIISKLSPSLIEKVSENKFSFIKILKEFVIGLLSLLIVTIGFILLVGTSIGAKLAIIALLLYIVLWLISVPVLSIRITNLLKPVLKVEKTSMFYLILVLVSIILYGIGLIPVVGGLLGFIITMIAIGSLIDVYLPHKELTDEEKAIIEEAKKEAKENKEKRKQEKLEAKEAKKQAKLEAKEAKKKDNTDL